MRRACLPSRVRSCRGDRRGATLLPVRCNSSGECAGMQRGWPRGRPARRIAASSRRLPGAAATAHNCALWALRAQPFRIGSPLMNRSIVAVLALVVVAVAAGGGYWLGQRRRTPSAAATGSRGRRRKAPADAGAMPGVVGRGRQGRRGADAAGDHRRRQPALRRVGDAAPRSRRARQRDRVPGRPADRPGHDDGAARSGDQRGRGRAGEGEPLARQDEVRARDRPAEAGLHLEPGEGRGGEQPAARRGGDRARGGAPREDRDQGAVRGRRRPALGVARRLREGGPGSRQPRVDRSAQGRLPRARGLPEAGRRRPDAGDRPRRAARQARTRARCSRSIRWSTRAAARS